MTPGRMWGDWLKAGGGIPEVANAHQLADGGTRAALDARDPSSKHYNDSKFRQGLQSSTGGRLLDSVIHYFKP